MLSPRRLITRRRDFDRPLAPSSPGTTASHTETTNVTPPRCVYPIVRGLALRLRRVTGSSSNTDLSPCPPTPRHIALATRLEAALVTPAVRTPPALRELTIYAFSGCDRCDIDTATGLGGLSSDLLNCRRRIGHGPELPEKRPLGWLESGLHLTGWRPPASDTYRTLKNDRVAGSMTRPVHARLHSRS